ERGTATALLNDKRFIQTQKQRIVHAAETAYDEYEDEYDDTYDDPERALPRPTNPRLKIIRDDVDEETTESEVEDDVEKVVYKWFKSPQTFERGNRKTREREQLRGETKWSDEQIEGWRSMIERDGEMLRRLERKLENQRFQ